MARHVQCVCHNTLPWLISFSLDGVMQRTIEILRQWEMPLAILFAYYVLAASFIWFVHRRWCSKRRAANPRRYRFIFALVLAVVFAPNVISDFWLFTIPGLAILELLL